MSQNGDMRALGLIWLPLMLSSCGKQQPFDCSKIDLPAVDRCFDQHRAKGEPAGLVACLPFSQQLKTSGTWVVGFEKNDFFEWGPRVPPAEVLWTESTGASLIVDDKIEQKVAPTGPQIYALQVEVVGRRALCPLGVINAYPIAVEMLKVTRKIGTR